jgi:hypothetical protein
MTRLFRLSAIAVTAAVAASLGQPAFGQMAPGATAPQDPAPSAPGQRAGTANRARPWIELYTGIGGTDSVSENGERDGAINSFGIVAGLQVGWFLMGGTFEGEPIYLWGVRHSHGGLLVGTRQRLGGNFQVELLAEAGLHSIGGLGDGLFQEPVGGPQSVELSYAGARLGVSAEGRWGLFGGAWLIARQDLEHAVADVTVENTLDLCLFPPCSDEPSYSNEHFELGGSEVSVALRGGMRF